MEENISTLNRRTLLIIEDSEFNRELLSELLSDEYNIILAENGQNGLDVLQDHYQDVSLILLDVHMPVMNGYEFLKIVKSDSLYETIPVIVATGSDAKDEEEKCLGLGASDFVSKPYNSKVVISRIASIIKLRESAATLHAVEYDDLTGLYTRQAFIHHAEVLLKKNPDLDYTLVIAEVEEIKLLNEKYGIQAGNEILKKIGNFLKAAKLPCVLVGRFGGDQFVLMLREDQDKIDPKKLEKSFSDLMDTLSASDLNCRFGIYENVDHLVPVSAICDRALMALQMIRGQYGKVYAKYDNSFLEELEKKTQIEKSMKAALNEEQFKVFYQPKHDANTGELIGAEALIRWIHPEYGFMSPGEFIPIFEKNGFITEVDSYVWKRTCDNLSRWMSQGIRVVPISVNGSKVDFIYPQFLEMLSQPADDMNIPPHYLHLEVTESLFADRLDELIEILQKCQDKGYQIELDDFGSGYSSLSTLAILPLNVVKMDMKLVRAIHDQRSLRVFSACINLAKSLGLKTVSEGVETEEQLKIIRDLGGDVIQGFYYSKPLPEDQFEEYLKKYSDHVPSEEELADN